MTKWIAERKLLFSKKGSEKREVLTIRIGEPYYCTELDAFRVAVEWDRLIGDHPSIAGMDGIQALNLATNVDGLLRGFLRKYDFFFLDGDPYFDEPDSGGREI